jgi:predicted naringenin-chalcone synthase
LSKIISIGTAVPAFKHQQQHILQFMQKVYAKDINDERKLKFLYHQSKIETRYSTLPDFSADSQMWNFFTKTNIETTFPLLEKRMDWYQKNAATLSINAINDCINAIIEPKEITHLITVSCTGMSAPGLDLQIVELLHLPKNIFRSSINFMGCYAAIHALKMADFICKADVNAKVIIVCTELCTLHFQKEATIDNIASSLLFADGAAAVLVTANDYCKKGLFIKSFFSEIIDKGKNDMSWKLSSFGFLMSLSAYVPDLIEADFEILINKALLHANVTNDSIKYWCIHPGGKRILDVIQKCLSFNNNELAFSYDVLKHYGNMSSPTILFVLKNILQAIHSKTKSTIPENVLGAAFGPGLTMETFILSTNA